MAIFKYEMKQYKNSVILWSVGVSAAIIFLVPVFLSIIADKALFSDDMLKAMDKNIAFQAMGISMQSFLSPTGIYSYVTSFLMIALAANGANIGLSIISKEYIQRTADFLMTKPYSRQGVFLSKLSAAAVCCSLVGTFYLAASVFIMQTGASGRFEPTSVALIALSSILIQLFYVAIGMLIAVINPGSVRTPAVLSIGIAFVTYIFTSYSHVVKNTFVTYLSPYNYFDSRYIREHGGYDPAQLLLFLALMIVFFAVSYGIFVKKDITTAS